MSRRSVAILFVLAMEVLTIMYFTFGFAIFNGIRLRHIFKKKVYEGTNTKRIIGGLATGICLSNLLTGVLFKLQYWPGANRMILLGLIPTIIVLVVIIFKLYRNKDSYYPNIQLRIAIIGTVAIILFLLPTLEIVKLQYRNKPEYIKAFENNSLYPSDESERKLDLEYHRATMNAEDFKMYEEFLKNPGL